MVKEEYRRADSDEVRRAVDDDSPPGAIEEEAVPATVRRVPAFMMRRLYLPLMRLASIRGTREVKAVVPPPTHGKS